MITFCDDCEHFHNGKIITASNEDLVIMFNNVKNKKIGKVSIMNVAVLASMATQEAAKGQSDSTKSLQILKSVDMKALALLIKLLELKLLFVKELEVASGKKGDVFESDYLYFKRNVEIIDKYLKNVLLKLRIREHKDFQLKDIQNNYVNILTKIKKSIKNESIFTNDQNWFKDETDHIVAALNRKLERKILFDINANFNRIKKETNVVDTNGHGEAANGSSSLHDTDNCVTLMKDCLGLIKCLQFEGDIELDKNGFYLRILKAISSSYEPSDSNKKMHSFSNSLFAIIDKFKDSKN